MRKQRKTGKITPVIWHFAAIAQLVERIHGKDEVSGSTPDRGSIYQLHIVVTSVIINRSYGKEEPKT